MEVLKKPGFKEPLQLKEVQHSKVPPFMRELYTAMVDSGGVRQGLGGNVVRSFAAQSNGAFHFFNLTSFSRGERVTKAELRWFRHAQPFWMGHHFYKGTDWERPHLYELTLILEPVLDSLGPAGTSHHWGAHEVHEGLQAVTKQRNIAVPVNDVFGWTSGPNPCHENTVHHQPARCLVDNRGPWLYGVCSTRTPPSAPNNWYRDSSD
ncbi:hypothetical protein NFI96_001971 [Prochilodus magdalenae]|nr:hypothetical protein NFI96_001971 [Prochilodus magdalenae]